MSYLLIMSVFIEVLDTGKTLWIDTLRKGLK